MEDLHISIVVRIEGGIETLIIKIEAVRVLHSEFSHPEQAALRARLITEFHLDLIPKLRKLLVGVQGRGQM